MKKVVVKQDDAKPVPIEVLADSIVAISAGIRKLRAGPLNERALILLIRHAAPATGQHPLRRLTQKEVKAVLDGVDNLEREYLRKRT